MQRRAQRQAAGDACHQVEVEAVGAELTAGHRSSRVRCGLRTLRLPPGQLQSAQRPGLTVIGLEAEVGGRQPHTGGLARGFQPAAHLAQRQRLQSGCQPQRHLGQRQVDGGGQRPAAVDVEPGAQRPAAGLQFEGQRHQAAEPGNVGLRQFGVDRAAPLLPVAAACQQRLREAAAHRKALAPGRRRRGVQAQFVATQAIAHHQLHVGQHQRRPVLQLVGPAQAAAAQHPFVLLEQPLGGGAVVADGAGIDVETRHVKAALEVTPHVQRQAVHQQLCEARPQQQQRARRQRGRDLRQPQRLAPLAVEEAHVPEFEGGHPAGRMGVDAGDAQALAENPARLRLDLRAPIVDVRQNSPVQSQPGGQHQADGTRHCQAGHANAGTQPAPGARRVPARAAGRGLG